MENILDVRVGTEFKGREMSKDFLRTMFPDLDGFIEIRSLHKMTKFPQSQFYDSIDNVNGEHLKKDHNMYFGVCPRKERKGTKEAVRIVPCLWVDIDGKDFEGGKEEAFRKLREFPFKPTAVVDSGNGFHAYWRFKESFIVENTSDVAKIESYLKAVANALKGDMAAAEIARILRLPGSFNYKVPTDIKPVTVLELNELQYNLFDFDAVLTLPIEQPKQRINAVAIPKGQQDYTLFRLACSLKSKGFTQEMTRSALKESIKTLKQDANNLFTDADIERWIKKAYSYPDTPKVVIEAPKVETKVSDSSSPIPLDEFLKKDYPPIEFYIDEFFPKRLRTMISAGTNKGKSIFIQNAALMIATGEGEFLGKKVCGKARVLYLDLEMGCSALQERFKTMATKEGLDLSNLFLKNVPDLNLLDEAHQKQVESWIQESAIELLILDPLGSCWHGDENNKKEVQGVTTYLNTLMERFNIGIIAVHHWRKSKDKFNAGGEMAAGSYLWTAWLDSHITLNGEIHSVSVSCEKARHGSRFKPFIMKLEDDLWFSYITNFEKKFTDETLISVFEEAGKREMPKTELLEIVTTNKICSRKTLDSLLKTSAVFESVPLDGGNKRLIRFKNKQETYLEAPDEGEWTE